MIVTRFSALNLILLLLAGSSQPIATSALAEANSSTAKPSHPGKEIWVSSNRVDGKGNGTQTNPFDAHNALMFQSVIDRAPAGVTIRMADGVYPKMSLRIAKTVTFSGSRKTVITQAAGAAKPIFALSGADTDFSLEGISLVHGTSFVEEQNVAAVIGGCHIAQITNIYSSDFNNTIYITDQSTQELDVEGCNFEYTYGRASVSNVSPYKHPCAAIAGNPKRLIVRNNRFNGLVDPSFAHMSESAPASQKQAADNFVQTGDHNYCLVEGNTVKNFGIEGIFIARGSASGDYTVQIRKNDMVGTVYRNQIYSPVYAPGIKLHNSRGEVFANTIANTNIGISAEFGEYNEAMNVVLIAQNNINRCLLGIEGIKISEKSVISANKVWNASEPVRSVWGPKAFPQELYGIVVDHGRVTGNTLTADEPIWDSKTELISRSRNVFTVASAAGISADNGALISYANGWIAAFPVRSINGNAITVDASFASTYSYVRTGTLFYASSFANGLSNGGIVVRSGGTLYADHNIVIGHRNDVSQQNSGFLVVTNHTARNCHVTNSNSRLPFLKP